MSGLDAAYFNCRISFLIVLSVARFYVATKSPILLLEQNPWLARRKASFMLFAELIVFFVVELVSLVFLIYYPFPYTGDIHG